MPDQPHLSVIVHGRNVQGHLAACLDGIADRPSTATEVIVAAVGASARRVADTYAARDPRFTTVPLPDGTSDGAARAAGAERARGTWLHFTHAKDRLPAGALRTIADATSGRPDDVDVVVMDHTHSTWHTSGVPSDDGPVLARAGRSPLGLADFPDLLRLTPLLGNRTLRATFWHGTTPEHPAAHTTPEHPAAHTTPEHPAAHTTPEHPPAHTAPALFATLEDEPTLAYATLVHARRIAAADQVVLDDRRLRIASLPPLTPAEQFAVVERYEAVQSLMAGLGTPRAARAVFYDVMVAAWLRIIARDALPAPVAKEFFHRASRAAARWRPDGHVRPEGLDGIRHALLEQDAFDRYRAFQTVNHKRRELRTEFARRKRKVGTALRDHRYRKALDQPVDDNLAVFSAYWDRGIACNPAAIAAKLGELAPRIHPVWVVSAANAPLLPPGTDHIVPGTRRYWAVMAHAKYLVNNVNFPGAVVKRPDAIHLQTHHGTPLKRMGLDQRDYPTASKGLNFQSLLARVDKWDYSVSANTHSTEMWESAYPSHFVSLDHGYPRNDVLHHATAADILAVRARLGVAPGRTALLYAPTHRDYEASWTPRLDLADLAERLGDDTVILVRGHYFYGGAASPLAGLRRDGRIIDVSAYDPVEELALAADALVTDYSSIMFDYANLDRPIVVYADDWETYAKTRGVYFDLMESPPGQVVRTQNELTEVFRSGAWRDASAAKARAAFRRRFCEFDDGRAAERVVRRVFLGEDESALPPVIPVDARTPVPTPEEAAAR
ncbi:CDP-glycerol glycerophosphotransferase family protein [Streptomyces sp. NPDC091292]|uniref:CDP-glycerol glycerophosphotransferase family protein n=1 Tax=Streptomyces sp. NPDC091292 TaxID=3365991 RepID=UPI00381197BE